MLVSDGDVGYLQLGRTPFASTADGGGTASYSLTDALGSVRAVTGPTGQVAATQSFDVWGAPRTGLSTTFGFAGEQHDPTGLIHLRARQYDPALGRFLSADAVQPNAAGTQGWNLYGYAAANPSTAIDPSGNVSLIEYTATAAIGGALVGALFGGLMGLLQCSGSGTEYALCVLRQAGIGAISGLVAGVVFALAYAALALMGAGWATTAGVAGAASGAAGAGVGGAFNGGPTLAEILGGAFLGAFAGVVGGWLARTPLGQSITRYVDDLLARLRPPTTLSDDIVRLADQHLTGSGETVLGHYADDYIGLAQSRGASYFDIGDAWNGLTPAQQWAANQRVLDAAIANGDRIILATARTNIRYPSALADEIQYLTGRGYVWLDDFTLVPGG
jgi:RHS repeat-associated protein